MVSKVFISDFDKFRFNILEQEQNAISSIEIRNILNIEFTFLLFNFVIFLFSRKLLSH